MPVHLKSRYHWMISIIHVKTHQLIVYNSMRSADFSEEEKWVAHTVERWWSDEWTNKVLAEEKQEWNSQLKHVILTELPQQVNSTDCGAFCMAYAYYASFKSAIPNKTWPSDFDGDNLRSSIGFHLLNQSPLLKNPESYNPQIE